tara:strand:+ start:3841 stop:5706 length:1866 start_codon:yes stop_codon:yes gene_type:complete
MKEQKTTAQENQQNREELETRAHYSVSTSTIEARTDSDDMIIEGYAALYDNETNIGPFKETIARGAFDDVMENDVRALLNHNPDYVLGRSGAGTLELELDDTGLKYRIKLGEQQYAKDLYESVKRGDISQSSFAFTIAEQSWSEDRTVRSVDKVATLLDVSPVTYPAYKDTHGLVARNDETEPEQIDNAVENTTSEENKEVKKTTKKRSKMNLKELNELRGKFYNEHVSMIENAESEGRELTNEEETRADYLEGEIERLDNKIKRRKAHEDMIARTASMSGVGVSEAKEIEKVNRNFSLTRAVHSISVGQPLTGAEAEWAQEARKDMQSRGMQMTGQIGIPERALYRAGGADDFQAGSGDGSGFVSTDVPGVIDALRAAPLIETVGATTIHGATGTVQFPRVSKKASGHYATEVQDMATAGLSGMEMDEVTLSPNRYTNSTVFSKMLVTQGGPAVDALIANELMAGVNEKIDIDAFAKTTTVNNTSLGGALTAANLFELEKDVLAAGGDFANCKWVMSPTGWKVSRDLATVASIDAFWVGSQFDGFDAIATPNLLDSSANKGQIVFGDFAKGIVYVTFGGLDLLVDPYSNAATNQIALHVTKFADTEVRQGDALASVSEAE